jgi:hypothetical protein
MELSNRETIASLGSVAVATLGNVRMEDLAEAGATLPIEDWIE